ncbi:hypothetical protein AAMO2058_001277400 [Amorphochlora amoebiformis]
MGSAKSKEANERLFRAIEAGKLKRVENALKEGANVNAVMVRDIRKANKKKKGDDKKKTPKERHVTILILAVIYRRLGILEKILENPELSINASDEKGCTGLHYAAVSNQPYAVKLLLKTGADPTLKSKYGTPLDMAKSYKARDAAIILEPYTTRRSPRARRRNNRSFSPRGRSSRASVEGKKRIESGSTFVSVSSDTCRQLHSSTHHPSQREMSGSRPNLNISGPHMRGSILSGKGRPSPQSMSDAGKKFQTKNAIRIDVASCQ